MHFRRTAAIVLRYWYLLRGNPARWLVVSSRQTHL